jgi:hypothetical protein
VGMGGPNLYCFMNNHHQATSGQNLKGLDIIKNYIEYNNNINRINIHIKIFEHQGKFLRCMKNVCAT